jgi:hypothetical protein
VINAFFDNFKKVEYDFSDYLKELGIKFSNFQNVKCEFSVLNVNKMLPIIDKYILDNNNISEYELKVTDTLFSVANDIYGDEDSWWLILYMNNMTGFDLPMTNSEINEIAEILFVNDKIYSSKKVYFDIIYEYVESKKKIKIIKSDKFNEIMRNVNKELSL